MPSSTDATPAQSAEHVGAVARSKGSWKGPQTCCPENGVNPGTLTGGSTAVRDGSCALPQPRLCTSFLRRGSGSVVMTTTETESLPRCHRTRSRQTSGRVQRAMASGGSTVQSHGGATPPPYTWGWQGRAVAEATGNRDSRKRGCSMRAGWLRSVTLGGSPIAHMFT
eukprot:CAMPEP_0174370154 /NCGR_PEP_ID=MMETSP0811_2-20130205/95118_1 /TAXON_ID=73025 ORGANISM="Eutreptiella gymnastica-like, Strain CCMP1594" /NCGR_SAMPLE_ID=MMETSP0811_2 /ASSEMBLY_ACC=CAM_ASM_000667 /LENGTH=166 /DNA_ID=CAMNT_0015515281 /DNA_START=22 /DNA_END=520 /DNA_ORIENTATION=+